MMTYEYASSSTTGCVRDGSLWNRAFVKGTCSHPFCSIYLLRSGYKRGLHAFKDIMDAFLVHVKKKIGAGGAGGGATAGQPVLATSV